MAPMKRLSLFLACVLLLPLVARAEQPAKEPAGYRLQVGDEVAVAVLPRSEYGFSGAVSPDGQLYLKNGSPIRAAGATLPELSDRVREALEKILKRPRVTVTLVKLNAPPQPDRVTVTGSVVRSGPLPIEPGLRVRKAIELAGGITLEADLARVTVIHSDLTRTVVDLSSEARIGNPAHNLLLKDGDSIEVPSRPKVRVTIVGGVTRPGAVESLDALPLRKALELAGGALKEADLGHVTVTHRDLTRTTLDLSGDEPTSTAAFLKDGDSVEVPLLYRPGFVSISGEVAKSGPYPLQPGMSLEDVIVAAGRMTLVADAERVEIRRSGAPRQVVSLTEQQRKGADGKLLLQPGDEVFVPRQENTVVLIGAIPNPGPRALKPGQTLKQFFTEGQAENFSALDDARVDLKKLQVIRRGAETREVNLRSLIRSSKARQDDLQLQSGDILFLPAREGPKKTFLDHLRALPIGGLLNLFIP